MGFTVTAEMHFAFGAGRKLVVFAHHGIVLDGIEEAVRKMKYTTEAGQNRRVAHMRIDGSTSQRARSDLVKVFQSDDGCRVAILSIKAAGVRTVKLQPVIAAIACFAVAHMPQAGQNECMALQSIKSVG